MSLRRCDGAAAGGETGTPAVRGVSRAGMERRGEGQVRSCMATRRDPGSWRHSQAPDRQMLESDKYRRSMVPPSPASRARPSPGSAGCRGVPPRAGEDAGIRGSGCAFIYRHHTSCGRASLSPTSRPSGSRRCVVIRASPAPRQCGARSPGISTNIGAVARKTCSGSGADATRTGSTTSAGCGESGPERELPGGRRRSEDAHRGRPSRGRPSSSGPPAHPGGNEKARGCFGQGER